MTGYFFLKIKLTLSLPSPCLYECILIYLHTFVGMVISRANSTQGPRLMVKVDMTEILSIM